MVWQCHQLLFGYHFLEISLPILLTPLLLIRNISQVFLEISSEIVSCYSYDYIRNYWVCQEDYRVGKWHFLHSLSSKDASFQHNMSLLILMWLRYCLSGFCSKSYIFCHFYTVLFGRKPVSILTLKKWGIKLHFLSECNSHLGSL